MLTLYHLKISHFSEKARWALDYKGLEYRSRLLTPGYHILTVRRVAGTSTVPVLVDRETGTVVPESTDILHYLDRVRPEPPLFPRDAEMATAVAEVEDALDTVWGPNASAYSYTYLLETPAILRRRWGGGLNVMQRAALFAAMPLFVAAIRRRRGLTREAADGFRAAAMGALDELEARLRANGGSYLVGPDFTAADLTAAALLGPFAEVPGSPWDQPGDGIPGEVLDFRREVAGRPAGEYARRMWAQHRA